MTWVAFVAGLALIEYVVFGGFVGWARGRYGVGAPATTGHPEFERYFRVHQNTLEQLAVFLPSLYLFAQFVLPWLAAVLGGVFVLGRLLYFLGYVRDPKARGVGFGVGYLATAALLLGGTGGALIAAF